MSRRLNLRATQLCAQHLADQFNNGETSKRHITNPFLGVIPSQRVSNTVCFFPYRDIFMAFMLSWCSGTKFAPSNPFQNIKNCIAECAIYLLCVSLYRINRSIRNEIIAINPYGRQFENDILRCIFQKMNFPFCFKFHRSFLEWSNCQHTRIGVFNVWARQRLKFYTKTDFT